MKFVWFVAIGLAGLCLLLLFVSVNANAMQQAAVGSMITAFLLAVYVIAQGIEGFAAAERRSVERQRRRQAGQAD
jgi:hypothetical protein